MKDVKLITDTRHIRLSEFIENLKHDNLPDCIVNPVLIMMKMIELYYRPNIIHDMENKAGEHIGVKV